MLLKDKTIIITGATKGIGRALAVAAAKQGANLVLGGRDTAAGDALVREIDELNIGKAVFVQGDLTQVESCTEIVQTAEARFGSLDGLVNYAGTVQATASLTNVTEAQFDWIMNVNFKSSFFVTQAAVNAMLRSGGGSIVFMGSLHAYGGEADRPAYACSKGAVHTLFKHVARNYVRNNIRSNWVTIGWVATPGEVEFRKQQGIEDGWLDAAGEQTMPMGRLQRDSDYVDGVLHLLSDGACQTSGSEMFITGGFML